MGAGRSRPRRSMQQHARIASEPARATGPAPVPDQRPPLERERLHQGQAEVLAARNQNQDVIQSGMGEEEIGGPFVCPIAAMRKHGNELAVIQTACYVLWSINADSPEEALIRTETAAGGGLPRLFAALDTFGTVGKVANAALVALMNVINNNPTNQLTFIELGGVEKMLGLVNHDDILIQKKIVKLKVMK